MEETQPPAAIPKLDPKRLERGLFRDGEDAGLALEIGDPRLDAVSDAAFRSAYGEAAGRAQQLWDDGVRDVRIIGYLLYGYFAERQMAGLGWVLGELLAALTTRWEIMGPANKVKQADGALNWLFQQLLRDLTAHEKAEDDVFRSWLGDEGGAWFAAACAPSAKLIDAIVTLMPKGKCVDKARALDGWLRQTGSHLARLADREAAAAEAAAAEAAAAASAAARATASDGVPSAAARPIVSGGGITVEGNSALGLVIRKLQVFETLIERQDMMKAAVVARDLEQLLQGFDPVAFLPKLFVPFLRTMSRNMDALEPAMQALESPSFRALVRFYQADLDAFAEP